MRAWRGAVSMQAPPACHVLPCPTSWFAEWPWWGVRVRVPPAAALLAGSPATSLHAARERCVWCGLARGLAVVVRGVAVLAGHNYHAIMSVC
jgi:hypothetical protein